MRADFLYVATDNAEVLKYAPAAEHLLIEVPIRPQDTSFTADLAAVIAAHAKLLAELTGKID